MLLAGLALAIVLFGVATWLLQRRRGAARSALAERRIEAYMQSLRRSGKADLAAMSDEELRDLLQASAHNLKVQSERHWYMLLFGAVAVFIAAVIVATEQGTLGFIASLAVGGLVLYGFSQYLGRRLRAPYEALGLDIERLRVE